MKTSRKVLILGGARFHGLLLAKHFCDSGDDVYVLNRGNYRAEYDFDVKHLKADRNDIDQLKKALAGYTFDAVIDNNAYTASQMRIILDLLRGRCGHYIFTSSTSFYFKLYSDYKVRENEVRGVKEGFYHPEVKDYAINKLFAELTLFNYGDGIDYTSIRLPLVFGEGDFAGKLEYFYPRLKDGGRLFLEKEVEEFSLIYVKDIVKVYEKAVMNKRCYNRVFNAADPHPYSYDEFFLDIYGSLYSKDKLVLVPAKKLWDLGYHIPYTWGPKVDTSLCRELLGKIRFTPLKEWGRRALEWEINHFKDKMEGDEFKKVRENELKLIDEHNY